MSDYGIVAIRLQGIRLIWYRLQFGVKFRVCVFRYGCVFAYLTQSEWIPR